MSTATCEEQPFAEAEREKALEEAKQAEEVQERQLQKLQQQLRDEIETRRATQHQLVERDRAMAELQQAMECGALSQAPVLRAQILAGMREVCSLQQQLAEELSKRQHVQDRLLTKEREVEFLRGQLLGRHASPPTSPLSRARSPPTFPKRRSGSPKRKQHDTPTSPSNLTHSPEQKRHENPTSPVTPRSRIGSPKKEGHELKNRQVSGTWVQCASPQAQICSPQGMKSAQSDVKPALIEVDGNSPVQNFRSASPRMLQVHSTMGVVHGVSPVSGKPVAPPLPVFRLPSPVLGNREVERTCTPTNFASAVLTNYKVKQVRAPCDVRGLLRQGGPCHPHPGIQPADAITSRPKTVFLRETTI